MMMRQRKRNQGGTTMDDAWDRAIAAEARRCRRLGLIFDQPACDWTCEVDGHPGESAGRQPGIIELRMMRHKRQARS